MPVHSLTRVPKRAGRVRALPYMSVKAARPSESGIQHLGQIGGGNHNDPLRVMAQEEV